MRARWLAAAALLALTGCESLSYYAQAMSGQLELMRRAHPLGTLALEGFSGKVMRKKSKVQMKQVVHSVFNVFTAVFILFLILASASLASLVNLVFNPNFFLLGVFASVLISSFYVMCRLLRRYVLAFEKEVIG